MLQKAPSGRASLEDIQAHVWLQGLDDALLSPEAPPHWLSGALSPSSPRPGVPECGDLLAARHPPHPQQAAFPGTWQPSLSLRPPPPEPPVSKTPAALQQICEEEEEEEDEEEQEEEEGLGKESEDWASRPLLMEEWNHMSLEGEVSAALHGAESGEEKELESLVVLLEEVEEMEEEELVKDKIELEEGESGDVISDQPVSDGDETAGPTRKVPPLSLSGFMGVQCCQGQPDPTSPEPEPNNNSDKPPPLLPQSHPHLSPISCLPASSTRLCLSSSEIQRTGMEGGREDGKEDGERDDLLTDRPQPRSAPPGSREAGPRGAGPEAALRAEPGKGRGVKLRERLFQFPLCEKALAFNIPTHNKTKILPLAQYNCCHVL